MAEIRTVRVMENILKTNDYVARRLREAWDQSRTYVVNLISAPGAGKTTLLETTLPVLMGRYRIGVLEGDIETERDADRIRALGVEAVQVTTGGTCHLEASMVEQAWRLMDTELDFLFIENVGNLVCPASFDLGEHLRVVLLSVSEGDDKPAKYPKAFRTAQVLVITKADLLEVMDFSVERARQGALEIQPELQVFVVSAKTGAGIPAWTQFLEQRRRQTFPEA
ncbi:MAG: hydrogenase nickel incorporation protein HypB [Acidobacteria bacterium]|nr:hydrogenase nickel incorporation protein HypB [Acidobacteriota bacterium]MDW7983113.1 hydrogenase nickel incorporation protein HypB [Acidobacteriota bacterium]